MRWKLGRIHCTRASSWLSLLKEHSPVIIPSLFYRLLVLWNDVKNRPFLRWCRMGAITPDWMRQFSNGQPEVNIFNRFNLILFLTSFPIQKALFIINMIKFPTSQWNFTVLWNFLLMLHNFSSILTKKTGMNKNSSGNIYFISQLFS